MPSLLIVGSVLEVAPRVQHVASKRTGMKQANGQIVHRRDRHVADQGMSVVVVHQSRGVGGNGGGGGGGSGGQ